MRLLILAMVWWLYVDSEIAGMYVTFRECDSVARAHYKKTHAPTWCIADESEHYA